MSCVEYSPVNIVTEVGEAALDLFDGRTILVCGESNYVFHDEDCWSEVIYVGSELFK